MVHQNVRIACLIITLFLMINGNPVLASGWIEIGDQHMDIGKCDEALEAYDHALRNDPNNSVIWLKKIDALSTCGEYDETVEFFDEITQVEPANASIWESIGDSLTQWEKYDDAIVAYEKSLDIDPGDVDTWYSLIYVLNTVKKYDRLVEVLDQASRNASLDDQKARFMELKADALRNFGQDSAVEAALITADTIRGNSTPGYYLVDCAGTPIDRRYEKCEYVYSSVDEYGTHIRWCQIVPQ